MRGFLIFMLLMLSLQGCIETHSSRSRESDAEDVNSQVLIERDTILSLTGEKLLQKELSSYEQNVRESNLRDARKKFEEDPDNLDNIIWYGRRLAYLGRYSDAIQVYTEGLRKYPHSYRLLRHRGHRYITTRQFDQAIDDLQKAAFYSRPHQNQLEPDGIPNRLNKPLRNDKFNVWYHLGIAYYLKGNYDKAISAFKICMTFCDNDDLVVATTDWFYMTYQKIGNKEAAQQLLEPIHAGMTVIENQHYLDRLLMYKQIYAPGTLLSVAEQTNNGLNPTLGYGVGNWYLYHGQIDSAKSVFEQILLNNSWDAFGYIAAEVDLLNLRNS